MKLIPYEFGAQSAPILGESNSREAGLRSFLGR